jgi:hypothetical protein
VFPTLLLAAVTAGGEPSGPAPDLSPPVRLQAAGRVIESGRVGHAAPFVGDFDGDGKPDLLVGQFEKGLLKVYRNEGTAAAPRLAAGQDFKAGAELGVVPAG